ncbi:MAG: hypothetical protein LBL87_00650 [Ruminococcus sp.]|jgi:hypothetical protein|nr:hypothetical protein [Ruminococcus sp.]
MKITDGLLQICVDSVAADVVNMYADKENISAEEAFHTLMPTKTYSLLLKPHSGLCLESNEYVYDMFMDEFAGNWERWLEI